MESVKPASVTLEPPPGRGGEIDVKCVGISKSFRDFWMRPRVRAVESLDLTSAVAANE